MCVIQFWVCVAVSVWGKSDRWVGARYADRDLIAKTLPSANAMERAETKKAL